MKILIVAEYYAPHIGGVETFFQHLAEGLAADGIEVTVATARLPGTIQHETLNGVHIRRIRVPRIGLRYWFTFFAAFSLWRLVSRFDLVHTTTYNAAFPAWIVTRLRRKKIVITVHEIWGSLWFRAIRMNRVTAALHWLFEQFIIRLGFDVYVGVSEYTKHAIEKIHGTSKNVKRIYHGIDTKMFDPLIHDGAPLKAQLKLDATFSYLYYGRTGWAKGIDTLLEAVPQIVKEVPDSHCILLLSRDPIQPFRAVEATIERLGIERNVQLLEPLPRKQLPDILSAVDSVVIPSVSEGFGFTTVESCAMGKPVAVSSAGSLPEVAWGDVHFFEPRDPEGLARAVIAIAKGEHASVPPKRFEWTTAITAYETLYQTLLQKST